MKLVFDLIETLETGQTGLLPEVCFLCHLQKAKSVKEKGQRTSSQRFMLYTPDKRHSRRLKPVERVRAADTHSTFELAKHSRLISRRNTAIA